VLIRVLALLVLALFIDAPSDATEPPLPPRLPRDFQWEGRYVVRDLGVDVPFTWHGKDGNIQMIAGGSTDPIHFSNILYNDHLYTITYKWPNTVPPPSNPECVCIGRLPLDTLNACLGTSRYVGAEILKDKNRGTCIISGSASFWGSPQQSPIRFGSRSCKEISMFTGQIQVSSGRYCIMGCKTSSIPRWMSGLSCRSSPIPQER